MYLSTSAAQSLFWSRALHFCAGSSFFINNDLSGTIWFAGCRNTWYLDKPWLISSLALHMQFGDMFYGRSSMMRTKVDRKPFRQRGLALRSPSEPQLSTCSSTVFANWVFSAKQETMLSVVNCLFSQNMKINLPVTKRAQQTTSLWNRVFLALEFNRCGLRARPL